MVFSPGTRFAGYEIEEPLAKGGMAELFVARDLGLGRKVALKLLATHLAEDQRYRERFIRESTLAASIDHPNILPIYDAGESDGILYIAMRYVVGDDLRALLGQEGRLPLGDVLDILGQIAGALDAAHDRSLIHRDVKPANVLLDRGAGGRRGAHAYLTDFGLSKNSTISTKLTATGQFVGTVDYTAPEQIEGQPVDGRTDQYSLACMVYECLSGARPFARDSEVGTMFAHLLDPAPRLTEQVPGVPAADPAGVDAAMATALAKQRDARHPTCIAFLTALTAALTVPAVSQEDAVPGPAEPAAIRRPRWRLGAP